MVAKRMRRPLPGAEVSSATGVLPNACRPAGTLSSTVQGILKEGSSKQGNARRASIDSNWVYAAQPPVLLTR